MPSNQDTNDIALHLARALKEILPQNASLVGEPEISYKANGDTLMLAIGFRIKYDEQSKPIDTTFLRRR